MSCDECGCKGFIEILKSEVVPALGCTEPIAVALAAAKAKEALNSCTEFIKVFVSDNILKNGMGVGIPGTGMTGLDIAAALGAIGGNPNVELEVLKDITKQNIEDAKEMLKGGRVSVNTKDVPNKLYIEVQCVSGKNISKAIIKDKHNNLVLVQLNEDILFQVEDEEEAEVSIDNDKNKEHCVKLSVEDIYDFAINCPFEDIEFILEGAKMNRKIAEEGLKGYGLNVGKTIIDNIKKGVLSDDIQNYAMALTAAASDARMAGCMYPVMSNSGSGNQGLTVMLPVVAVAEKLNASSEKLARALVLSNLIAIHIKTYLGRLSALCGCVVASAGASCGITYLLGGQLKEINYSIKNMVGNISGMICDGAKTGCALKVSTGVSAAVQSSLLAMNNIVISEKEGIIEKDVEKTIKNIAQIGREGMLQTDKLILNIMTHK
ncbi:serine dehydratase subunit alpha family protein [Haloimpatiens lingqiaonensis]|uniref:L-cysteine desulfidase family protein n=1 Tax=Haloimpatiens lingqiaonensis TaxID=1380675 RepID=UPI0010FF47EC|nr:L-serine ammonia-lyase, iron-sulfur-dependent, subunit alpha [Haloimpatiens lingqiaonensis]